MTCDRLKGSPKEKKSNAKSNCKHRQLCRSMARLRPKTLHTKKSFEDMIYLLKGFALKCLPPWTTGNNIKSKVLKSQSQALRVQGSCRLHPANCPMLLSKPAQKTVDCAHGELKHDCGQPSGPHHSHINQFGLATCRRN